MLESIADAIESHEKEILAANEEDMQQAHASKTDSNLIQRLQLKPQKLQNLCAGIRAIAKQDEPLRKVRHSCRLLCHLISLPARHRLVLECDSLTTSSAKLFKHK